MPATRFSYRKYTEYDSVYARLKKLDWVVKQVAERCPPGGRILDFGCGTGNTSVPLASLGYRVVGVDCDRGSIEQAMACNPFSNASFQVVDPHEPRIDGPFDVIVCSEVLEHIYDPRSLLVTFGDHLRSEGVLLITTPNGYGPWELVNHLRATVVGFLDSIKVGAILRRIRRDPGGASDCSGCRSTLNPTAHKQRFSFGITRRLLLEMGFEILEVAHSDFVSGIEAVGRIFSPWRSFYEFDQRIADVLPALLVSGWYLVCKER